MSSSSPATPAFATLRSDESVAKQLFLGNILEENLFPYPEINARDKEMLGAMTDAIDQFLADKGAALKQYDRDAEQPAEFIQALREMGLFGLIIPEQFGGMELSNGAYARVLGQTSSHDSSVSLTIGAHSSIGMKGLLLFGSDEQKQRYLAKLATGEMIAAFCLTESGAGSDAASIRTKATRNDDGSWTLSGEKIWITNGGIADFYTVFARTDTPEGKITAFLVEAKWPGVSHGPHEDKMGIRASSTTTVAFADVRVPAENVLGPVGKGFKVAMTILNSGRTGLGGGAVGGMRTLIRLASAQAKERKQFGQPIAEFGLVREKIAQMTVDCFAAESAVWMVAHLIDGGGSDYSVEAAMSKVFASEAVQRASYEALQIAAGNGFMREFPYEQITRDTRILSIFEGTNEILRLYIALSGLKGVGAGLSELKAAVGDIFNEPIKGFGVLGSYTGRRMREATGYGIDRIAHELSPRLRKVAATYEKYTVELSRSSDALLRRYGKKVADMQHAQKRLGDIAIDLFVGLCVLSRADSLLKQAHPAADEAVNIAEVFAKQARRRMARNVRGLERNEDEAIEQLAGAVLAHDGYMWDVI
ncbi:acyl-CoA dehydrogenase [Rhodanobacter thiooxydans]|uniref:Acyl-CoA dehydrogenase n=1 Tax=Rhodanobacter thiooxydans TaxID=416169 RepID=A0A154QIJ5_9GAMM|nr:acyl-CoA dehydrogenase family protein [Rhodanobacter thiooxydans]EIL97441.1 acyl-CoA dehydrogenase [Rhodanobacter thiooxydans LCS2]KZC24092.1 acyl-CoA dehydrogenase [Rhodanobacter thiooxydans]MCW0201888.1 acyl-CoA dehydrogenase family protein [Rhodanobacter thiooxydans]